MQIPTAYKSTGNTMNVVFNSPVLDHDEEPGIGFKARYKCKKNKSKCKDKEKKKTCKWYKEKGWCIKEKYWKKCKKTCDGCK